MLALLHHETAKPGRHAPGIHCSNQPHAASSILEAAISSVGPFGRDINNHMQEVRSAKAVRLVSDAQIRTMTSLINTVVDLSFFDEIEEQEIFEYSVCRIVEVIATVLPPLFVEMVRIKDPAQGVHLSQRTSDIGARMHQHVQQNVVLPFLVGSYAFIITSH
jgi:hypothetical protein